MNLYYESSNELYHHGVKGMKWGRRRYQNADGSLTPAGIKRYATKGYTQDSYNSNKSRAGKVYDKVTGAHKLGGQMTYELSTDKQRKARAEKYAADEKARQEARNTPEAKAERRKKAIKVGAAVAGTALAAYGAYKVNQYVKDSNAKIAAARQYEQSTKMFERMSRNKVEQFTSTQNSANPMLSGRISAVPGRDARAKAQEVRDTTKFRDAARNVKNYKQRGGSLKDLPSVKSYNNDELLFEIDKTRKQFTRVSDMSDRPRLTKKRR